MLTIVALSISCNTTIPTKTNTPLNSYTLVVEGFDWGPGASKVILPLEQKISKAKAENYTLEVNKKASCGELKMDATSGERTVIQAYVSDHKGNKMTQGSYITLDLEVSPDLNISSPMQYVPQCSRNVWADYSMTITNLSTNKIWDTEVDRIHPLIDKFNLSGKFVNSDITLTYADFIPNTKQDKSPLIIWLHGGGEGGTDTTIPLLANRAANYASSEIQAFFGGAYVLVPQSPTFWMDKGTGEYTRGDVNDMYNTSLMALIKDYITKHPNIDTNRIYVGGCSNGGYMSVKLMLEHPDFFAASFPSALAYHAAHITDEQIESIKHMPIWFIHSNDDSVTKAEETVVPLYKRLIAAGAENVHYSAYDHVIDITGLYGGEDYKYMGHFSWIYSHSNHCTRDYDGNPVLLNGKAVSLMEWLSRQTKSN